MARPKNSTTTIAATAATTAANHDDTKTPPASRGRGRFRVARKPEGLQGAGDGREDVVDLAAEQGQNDNDHDGDQDEDQSVLNQALALFPQIIELAHCSKSPYLG